MSVRARMVPEHVHTALRVRDLEGARRFYGEVVGLAETRVGGDPARPNSVWLEGIQLVRAEGQDTAEKGVLDHIGLSVANKRRCGRRPCRTASGCGWSSSATPRATGSS
jgi:catechol 2,3-dioxygenase-like lactoylglutathione lyase family enzyme